MESARNLSVEDISVERIDKKINQEITINAFNYSQLNKETASYLKEKEENVRVLNGLIGEGLTDLGKELKEANDKLAKHGYGCFEEWYISLGFKKTGVYQLIQRYNLIVHNVDNQDLIEQLPPSLSYEIAKPSAKEELVKKVLEGEITSRKEYKELEEKLKQEQGKNQIAEEMIESAKSTIENLKQEKEQIDQIKAEKERLEKQLKFVKNKPVETDKFVKEIDRLRKDYGKLKDEKQLVEEKLESKERIKEMQKELARERERELEKEIERLKKEARERESEKSRIRHETIQELLERIRRSDQQNKKIFEEHQGSNKPVPTVEELQFYLKESYRALSQKYHPDKSEGNEEKFKIITKVNDFLKEKVEETS